MDTFMHDKCILNSVDSVNWLKFSANTKLCTIQMWAIKIHDVYKSIIDTDNLPRAYKKRVQNNWLFCDIFRKKWEDFQHYITKSNDFQHHIKFAK